MCSSACKVCGANLHSDSQGAHRQGVYVCIYVENASYNLTCAMIFPGFLRACKGGEGK